MLVILSALLAGAFVFSKSGFVTAAISAVCGYAAFVAYAYVRSGITVRDPIHRLSLAVGHPPNGAIRIERFVAAILVPAVVAYVVYRVLS